MVFEATSLKKNWQLYQGVIVIGAIKDNDVNKTAVRFRVSRSNLYRNDFTVYHIILKQNNVVLLCTLIVTGLDRKRKQKTFVSDESSFLKVKGIVFMHGGSLAILVLYGSQRR